DTGLTSIRVAKLGNAYTGQPPPTKSVISPALPLHPTGGTPSISLSVCSTGAASDSSSISFCSPHPPILVSHQSGSPNSERLHRPVPAPRSRPSMLRSACPPGGGPPRFP